MFSIGILKQITVSTVEEYLAARNIRHVLAAKNFPKKSVVEIRAMICALWAVRKDWLEYRKKKNRLFQKLEEAEYVFSKLSSWDRYLILSVLL